MPSPFDSQATVDFAPAGQEFAEGITLPQRKYLRDLMLDKAVLKGIDPEQADDMLDSWFADMTKREATRQIDRAKADLKELRLRARMVAAGMVPA